MNAIRAVLFDMGGTLEDIYYDDASRLEATRGLRDILRKHHLDSRLAIPDLRAVVASGMQRYQDWREATEIELPVERVWTEYVLRDLNLPKDRLVPIAEELAFWYDTRFYTRTMRREVPAMLDALRARGFRLGVISNVISRGQVAHSLRTYELDRHFQVVMTSSGFGWRKPSPRIFKEAARLIGLPPGECAYVGDTISRDVVGARRAGYGMAIQIKSFLTDKADRENDVEPPDAVVRDLSEVIALVGRTFESAH